MKPKIFTLITLCIFAVNLFSQPTIVGQKTMGGNSDDYLSNLYLTNDGGMIVGGWSNSGISGEKSQPTRGNVNVLDDNKRFDYWVVKLSRHQKIQWNKTIGGSLRDVLAAVQQTRDGGYILGGYSASGISREKTQASRGGYDYWIVKLDSSGTIEWDKTVGGNDYDELQSLQQTNDGGYILGGYSLSDISGEKTQASRGGYDYWIVKLDSSGNIKWDKTIGGNSDDELQSLQQTGDGGYILGGYSWSGISGDKSQSSRGVADYWIVKIDSSGTIEWDKTIGGNYSDYLYSLQQTKDGGYILGGTSNSAISGEKTQASRGNYEDYWIIKLDSSGTIEWDKTIGGNYPDYLRSLQQTSDSGYILGGYSQSGISREKTENNDGGYDYWVVKLSKKGHVQWDKTIGGNNADILRSIKEISKNHYVLGGMSNSEISYDKTDSSRGRYDYWIVYLNYHNPALKTANVTNITANNIHNNFSVYPVPAKDILHVITNGKTVITLTDLYGKILLTKTINGSETINVASFAPGVYYLKNNATGSSQKVIVIK